MLRCIIILAVVCLSSAIIALGLVVPVARSLQNMLLVLSALSATVLVSSFDAFETQAASPADPDDEA